MVDQSVGRALDLFGLDWAPVKRWDGLQPSRPTPELSLWDWAVEAYAAARRVRGLPDLQDGYGQNVPLLLWAAWTAATGRVLDEDTIEGACDCARAWDAAAVAPAAHAPAHA